MSTHNPIGLETSGTSEESREVPSWRGPFVERSRTGEPTGERYVRCSECGVEVLEQYAETAGHRPGCSAV